MDGATLAGFEWAIMLGIALAFLIYDLRKTRREIREAKARDRERGEEGSRKAVEN